MTHNCLTVQVAVGSVGSSVHGGGGGTVLEDDSAGPPDGPATDDGAPVAYTDDLWGGGN